MSVFEEWKEVQSKKANGKNVDRRFWTDYYKKEEEIYKQILTAKENKIEGTIKELAEKYGVEPYEFIGFVDGIATSLNNDVKDFTEYEEDDQILLDIDFEKLLYNMHLNKAPWLFGLEEWDGIFSKEKQQEIEDKYHYGRTVRKGRKIGRNEPCPCGSGKKYKHCCGRKTA